VSTQPSLRIAQFSGGGFGRHRVEIVADIPDRSLSPVIAEFPFAMTSQDYADIRWYLEDYLEFPENPASLNRLKRSQPTSVVPRQNTLRDGHVVPAWGATRT
jgi:hypothetical protein